MTGGLNMTREERELELAKIAYEAYCESTDWKSAITGDPLPQFNNCRPSVQKAWLAVVERMIEEII